MPKADWGTLLAETLGEPVKVLSERSVGGGCINEATILETSAGTYFVKRNDPEWLPAFQAEANNLRAMAATQTIRVPRPLGVEKVEHQAVLLMEHLDLGGKPPGGSHLMGERLAALHAQTAESFGWEESNFIGTTPQPNPRETDWIAFFRDHRLGWQAQLLAKQGRPLEGVEALQEGLEAFFMDTEPVPSLLHGDLWGGNAGFLRDGEPVLYDPACYYGHDEADLAFTEMFGGFDDAFYEAYYAIRPRREGYTRRKELYNLYHLMNHALLFGGGYGAEAQRTIHQLRREL